MSLLILLVACEEEKIDTGSAPLPPWEVDADGDGSTADLDCDDADESVFPGADEQCDGLDQDCDGTIDESASDAAAWYPDADEDGYGDRWGAEVSCTEIPGYLTTGTDCDDEDAQIHPLADERCNGEDDDCDDTVDEGDPPDSPTWYADTDGDGYGDPATALVYCVEREGWIADGTDCDDAHAEVNPGAVETCNLADEDCDDEIDEDAGETWYADADSDGFGDPAVSQVACEAPEGYVADSTECDDGNEDIRPGAPEACDGIDTDCDGTVDEDAVNASTWYADSDGDGFGDEASTVEACDAPAGYVDDRADCDDTDATIGDDADGDGVIDCPDADGDGIGDVAELDGSAGWVTDPLDADTDGDGVDDGDDPAPLHEACDTAVLVWDTFDADPVDWSVVSGTWAWDGAAWTVTGTDAASSWPGEESWTDFAVDVEVTIGDDAGDAGVLLRTPDGIDGWYVALDPDRDHLVVGSYTSGEWTELYAATVTIDPGTVYTLGVEVLGSDLELSVDGAALLRVSDSTWATGSLALRAEGTTASFGSVFACE